MADHAKQPACANCHYHFQPGAPNEFCPSCGQQNHDVKLGFGHVLEEGLEGIFHFDSKVFRTLRLLLFKPGQLTLRFLAGHRVPYVPPIRLYVFISFVFFALLSLLSSPKATKQHGKDEFSAEKRKEYFAQPAWRRHDLATWQQDSLMNAYRQMMQEQLNDTTGAYDDTNGANIIVGGVRFTLAEYKRLTTDLTDAQLDSLITKKGYSTGFFTRKGVRVLVSLRDATPKEIFNQLLRGTSIMLFLLMPLAALLLQLAYFRRHRHYVSHLVFTVHTHCFLFVYIALLLVLMQVNLPQVINWVLVLVPVVYFVVALRTFYQQSWAKTMLKSLLLGGAYSVVLVVAGLTVGFGALLYF